MARKIPALLSRRRPSSTVIRTGLDRPHLAGTNPSFSTDTNPAIPLIERLIEPSGTLLGVNARDISPTRPQCEPSWTWFAHPSSLTVNSDSCNSGGAMLSCRLDFADVAHCLCLSPVQCAMLYLVIGGLGHEASGFGPAGWRRTLLSRMGLTLAGGKFDSH